MRSHTCSLSQVAVVYWPHQVTIQIRDRRRLIEKFYVFYRSKHVYCQSNTRPFLHTKLLRKQFNDHRSNANGIAQVAINIPCVGDLDQTVCTNLQTLKMQAFIARPSLNDSNIQLRKNFTFHVHCVAFRRIFCKRCYGTPILSVVVNIFML